MKIGIDIGGSHMQIGLINENNEIIKEFYEDLKDKENVSNFIIEYLDEKISELKKNFQIERIGISIPGTPKGTIVENINNLGIKKIDFGILEKKHNIKINVINDGLAAAIAEKELGAMKEFKDCVFLCMGTGIGSAVFMDGKLLKPVRNSGFEIGHMIIDKNGKECKCEKCGCFETYCSMKEFKKSIREVLVTLGETEENLHGENLKIILNKHTSNKEIQVVITNYIDNMIVGLSNIIDIFEPEAICFGGSFIYYKEMLYDKLIEEMKKRKYVFNKQSELPQMILAKYGNRAGLIGSILNIE